MMQTQINFTELRELIAQDELGETLSRLQTALEGSRKLDEIIIQFGRYRELTRRERSGVLDEQQVNISKNKIRSAMLDLIRELETEEMAELEQRNVYKSIAQKIHINRGAGTSEILANKTIGDLDEKELSRLFEQARVIQFFRESNLAGTDLTVHQKLLALSLVENGHVYKGTFLCLGQQNQLFSVCHTAIEAKFIQFKGTERNEILILESLQGNLLRQFEKMMLLLRTHVPLARDRARSEDVYEIPIEALREFVANAFIHRDYGNEVRSYIQVELLDDRLEIKSPGHLPENLDIQNIRGTVLVNPAIAAIFHLYKHIERAGTGIQVAQQTLKSAGLNPAKIENVGSPEMVVVTIFRKRHQPSLPHSKPGGFFQRLLDGLKYVFAFEPRTA